MSSAMLSGVTTEPSTGEFDQIFRPAGEYTCQVTVLDAADKKVAFWQTPILLVGK